MQTAYVATEGDELYYQVCGKGRPLLIIPGAFGDALWYSFIADILSEKYKVITFDRRSNARSTMNHPHNFDIGQQSRDAVAVLHAAGEQSAYIVGNSSGAVIALNLAETQPQAVLAAVAHEPPLARLHPKASQWVHFFKSVYNTSFKLGSTLAVLKFAFGVGLPFPGRDLIKAFITLKRYRKSVSETRLKSETYLIFL